MLSLNIHYNILTIREVYEDRIHFKVVTSEPMRKTVGRPKRIWEDNNES